MTDRPIVFLDCETNGLHADRRPWEIAWIRREIDGTETERCIQIADVDLTDAQAEALEVGGFDERWKGGPRAVEALYASTAVYGMENPYKDVYLESDAAHVVYAATLGAVIVGVVPSFDTHTLAEMFRRHSLCPRWHHRLFDVANAATGWLGTQPQTAQAVQKSSAAATNLRAAECHLNRTYSTSASGLYARDLADLRVAEAREDLDRAQQELRALTAPAARSDDLSRACGVEPPSEEERHTALGDARWVQRWYDHILGGAA